MSEFEHTTLRRCAVVLLLISLVRWHTTGGTAAGERSGEVPGGEEALAVLTDSSRRASEEAERRARPLGPDERIDPNSAGASELDRLPRVGASTAAAIVAARDSGVVFRTAGDLLAVRGIGPRTIEGIAPHLVFGAVRGAPAGPRPPTRVPGAGPGWAAARRPVDVNRASAEALTELPGIGPALAGRIVEARRSEPFRSLQDLTRVRGIGPSTVSRLVGLAGVGPAGR